MGWAVQEIPGDRRWDSNHAVHLFLTSRSLGRVSVCRDEIKTGLLFLKKIVNRRNPMASNRLAIVLTTDVIDKIYLYNFIISNFKL